MMNEHDRKAAQIVRDACEPRGLNGYGKIPHTGTAAAAQVAGQALSKELGKEDEAKRAAYQQLLEEGQLRMAQHQDAIIRMLITQKFKAGEVQAATLEELGEAIMLYDLEDGRREIHLNGKLLIVFWPPALGFEEDGSMLVQLAYKVAA